MTSRPANSPAAGEISLAASTYLELGLAALSEHDIPRAASCLAAIDAGSWAAILARPSWRTRVRAGARTRRRGVRSAAVRIAHRLRRLRRAPRGDG